MSYILRVQERSNLLLDTYSPIRVSRKRGILDKKMNYYDDDTLIKALNILINKEMITKELLVFVNKFNLG